MNRTQKYRSYQSCPKPKPSHSTKSTYSPAHGGKRAGSGKKKTTKGSIIMRIPLECADAVTKLVNDYKLQTTNPIYQIEIDGGVYKWSGKGSMPMPFCNFIWRNPKKWEELVASGGNLQSVTTIKKEAT